MADAVTSVSQSAEKAKDSRPSAARERLKAGDCVPGYKFGQACYVPTADIREDDHHQPQSLLPLPPLPAQITSTPFRRAKSSDKANEDAKEIARIGSYESAASQASAEPNSALLGLFQENEKWGKQSSQDDSDVIIMTWRMQLAKLMDSIYVNLLVIIVVLIDVGSIVYFEAYQDPAEKDCFNRDHPIQARITIFALSCFTVELLLRMIGRGPRIFFACRLSNFWNWFDMVIVGSSVLLAAFKFADDATHLLQCEDEDLCPPENWMVRTNYSETASFCDGGVCPWIPSPPYAEIDDEVLEEMLWLCDNEGVNAAQKVAGSAVSSTRIVSRIIVGLRIIRAITGVNRVRRVGSHIRTIIRARASKGTRRYRMLGFDLDMCYITNRCIAMAAPSTELLTAREADGELFGLNDANMVARLLAIRHYAKFRVYNLCEESLGDYAPTLLFSQVTRIPIRDRHPPMIKDVLIFCDNVARYLLSDARTVVALHCSSGIGRTGVMVACWLLYSGHRVYANDALDLFASRRSGKQSEDGSYQHCVKGPSEKRAVSYLEAVLYHNISISASERVLTSITFLNVHSTFCMSVQVICQNKILHDSGDKSGQLSYISPQNQRMDLPDILTFGDTELVFFRHKGTNRKDRSKDFFICLHTAFHRDERDVEFPSHEIDWVTRGTDKLYPEGFQVQVNFVPVDSDHALVAPFRKFRETLAARGAIRTFHRGETIVEAGSKARSLYLILKGNVSQVVEESWGLSAADTETVTVALLSEGDVLGAGAFCLGLPETRHLCASPEVKVAVLHIADHGPADAGLEIPGYAPHELPQLFKILSQLLCWEYSRNFKVSTMFTKVASSSSEDENLRTLLRRSAAKTFRLADYEECTFVHRCKVNEAGLVDVIAKRIIFFTRHILLDPRGSSEKIGEDARIFKVSELEDAVVNYPEVQSLTIVLSDREYEVQCGTASAAKNLLLKFEALLNNEFFEFERTLRQEGDRLGYLSPFLNIVPKVHYNCNDVLMEAGVSDQGIWHVVKGSLQVMDGKRRVAILEAGSLVGDMEYLTSTRMGFTVSVRSSDGADMHRLPRPLLDGLVVKREVALPFYLGMAGHFAGKIFSQLIVDKPSAYVSPEKERLLKLKAEAKEVRLFKLLKLRKSPFLRMLNNDSIKELAKGSRTRTLRPGQVLLKQGEHIKEGYNDVMYVVLSGTLRALLNNGLGMMEVEQMTTGNVIGEQGVLLNKPRSATVEALSECELAEVKKVQVETVLKNNPQLREALDATMQTRMARAPRVSSKPDDSNRRGSVSSMSATSAAPSNEPEDPRLLLGGPDSSSIQDIERELPVPAPPTTPHVPAWTIDDLQELAATDAANLLSPPPAPPLPRRRQSAPLADPLGARPGPLSQVEVSSAARFAVFNPALAAASSPPPDPASTPAPTLASARPASPAAAAQESATPDGGVYSSANLVFSPNSTSARLPSSRAQRLMELGKQMGMGPPSQGEAVVRARKKIMHRAQSR